MNEEMPLKRGDRAEHLVRALRRAIIVGEIPPGTALRQEELARAYSSSRMPLREALRVLNAEGLVVMEPNRGAVVAPLELSELRENFEMRESAEVLAMRIALPHISNAQIDMAAEIQEKIEQSENSDFGTLNKVFHKTLYEPCNRPRLLAHISSLHDIAERYLRFTVTNLDYVSRSSNEHKALLKACYKRDADKVLMLTSQHILEAGKTLEKFLQNNQFLEEAS